MAFVKRASETAVAQALALSKSAVEWAKKHPAVHEYLTATKYEDGGQRMTSTLMAFVDGGEWRVLLNDRDAGQGLWSAAGSLQEALEDLEAMLKSQAPPWKKNRQGEGKQGKKR